MLWQVWLKQTACVYAWQANTMFPLSCDIFLNITSWTFLHAVSWMLPNIKFLYLCFESPVSLTSSQGTFFPSQDYNLGVVLYFFLCSVWQRSTFMWRHSLKVRLLCSVRLSNDGCSSSFSGLWGEISPVCSCRASGYCQCSGPFTACL